MTFAISGSQILVSGSETGTNLRTWAASNTSAAKQLTDNAVEAIFQIKIQNGGVLDTSDVLLVINHCVEGQTNAATDTGIWRCKGAIVLVKGGNTMFAEEWAIQDWEDVQVLIHKNGGNQSFIGSNARPTAASIKRVKFFVKSGSIDAHLQSTGGTGVVDGLYIKNETASSGIIALRDTDTASVEMYGVEPFGWGGAPTTLHQNWTLKNTTADEINYHYRRNNGGAIFYNVINASTGSRMRAVRYVSNGAEPGDGARSVIVGAYKPVLQDTAGTALSGVEVVIRRDSDGAVEVAGVTGSDGKIVIVSSSSSAREQSYSNTFSVGGKNYTRVLYHAGIKYIKQSVTPATAGGNVVSVDQGTFTVTQRRADMLEIASRQNFHADYSGVKTFFADPSFTGSLVQANAITGVTFTYAFASNTVAVDITGAVTGQQIYNYWKHWTAQSAQMGAMLVPIGLIAITNGQLVVTGTLTTSAAISAAGNVITVKTTGTITISSGGSILMPYVDSTADSYLSFEDVTTWTVCSNAGRTTQLGTGAVSDVYRFLFSSGTTYYLTLNVNGEDLLKTITPASSGGTRISLSSVALLSALIAKVNGLGTPLQSVSYVAPANSDIAAIKSKTDNLPAQPAAVGSAMTLTSVYDPAKTSAPTASQNASAMRTELATELSLLDVAVSSRLPTSGYTVPTAPPTVAQIRTELETMGSKLDKAMKAAQSAEDQTL